MAKTKLTKLERYQIAGMSIDGKTAGQIAKSLGRTEKVIEKYMVKDAGPNETEDTLTKDEPETRKTFLEEMTLVNGTAVMQKHLSEQTDKKYHHDGSVNSRHVKTIFDTNGQPKESY